jgi:hypothetical protein
MMSCGLLPHTPLWESLLFVASSHIHGHPKESKLQEHDLLEMVHPKLALHLSFIHYVDALKIHMRSHSIDTSLKISKLLGLGALQVDLQVTIAGPTYREEILFGNRVCS